MDAMIAAGDTTTFVRWKRDVVADFPPAVQQQFEKLAFTPAFGTRQEFATFMKSEIAKWSKVAHDSGARAD